MVIAMKEREKQYNLIIKCVVALVFPTILCVIYCIIRGTSIFELYVPDSYNNDSLFYYKMVQGVLENGFPQGYFGYNESKALVGSFGVWSPLLLLPWIIWGAFFGWSYTSVFFSNIFFFSLAFVIFVILTKIEGKAMLTMLVILSLIPSLPLHLLSCLPEANLLSAVLIFWGLSVGIRDTKYKKTYIIIMSVICLLLTIIRPFMTLLFLVPCYYLFKEKIRGAIIYTFVFVIGSMGLYFLGSRYFSAPYFETLFNFSLFEYILQGNFAEAYSYVADRVRNVIPVMINFIKDAFDYGLTSGTQYVMALMATVISLYNIFRREKTENRIVPITLVVMNLSIIGATILLHGKVNEGGRHIFVFAITGCILCCLEKGTILYILKGGLVSVLLIFIYQGALVPTDYDIPMQTSATKSSIEYWEGRFEEKNITLSETIGYENTLIWCEADYNELYAVPKGMGISCCQKEWVEEHFSELKSRYIAVTAGNELDHMCRDSGFDEIGRTERMSIYQRY